ncbi:hypothetical protein D8674_008399 [Pyrus ussuriensis x Pyrus communis]|uniref:Uncharacterized protein n=1 Tax=Pyrus ussuriensis x Pyrus communis TaxID=2448454 RepID=A0A5N5HZK8_9ROSA|nr:hypothetical protein D8674_008399 [Pyrus ussuriensis x Pyrus communis]
MEAAGDISARKGVTVGAVSALVSQYNKLSVCNTSEHLISTRNSTGKEEDEDAHQPSYKANKKKRYLDAKKPAYRSPNKNKVAYQFPTMPLWPWPVAEDMPVDETPFPECLYLLTDGDGRKVALSDEPFDLEDFYADLEKADARTKEYLIWREEERKKENEAMCRKPRGTRLGKRRAIIRGLAK